MDEESKDTVRVCIGVIATVTAVALGFIIASAKSSYDPVDTALKDSATQILALDRVLARYGPETVEIRKSLKRVIGARIDMLWPQGSSKPTGLDWL